MPNKDRNHDVVVRALQKAGWDIIGEQVYISVVNESSPARRLYIDLQAEYVDRKIVLIEVKALDTSPVHELMELLGQYLVYRLALDHLGNTTPLYVAISEANYEMIVLHPIGQLVLAEYKIPFVIYNIMSEEIIQWIPKL